MPAFMEMHPRVPRGRGVAAADVPASQTQVHPPRADSHAIFATLRTRRYLAEVFMGDLDEHLLLRSPIHFDLAPGATADFHPASHITINDPSCQIPARSPLKFDTFIKFVLENFYLQTWQHSKVRHALAFSQENECLSAHDKGRAYLNWAHMRSRRTRPSLGSE
jgi:hypothetical protein